MLEIVNLTAVVDGQIVLRDLNLVVKKNQTVALFGPNGSGKTALFKVIMGLADYQVKQGEIIFKGKKINNMTVDKRHELGLSMMFQQPPAVQGVTLKRLINQVSDKLKVARDTAEKIKVEEFLDKGLNVGLSGGEQKRSELFQMMINSQAQFYLFDEPDSGVDLENLQLIGEIIESMVEKKAGLIITHTGDILKFVQADLAYVMIDGQIICSGDSKTILDQITEQGYSECFNCDKESPDE